MTSPLVTEIETVSSNVPQHIAIIMDGNRRWAQNRGLPVIEGHRRGARAVRVAVEGANELGVKYLTLYAFSTENWSRPAGEIRDLMGLLRYYLNKEVKELHRNGVRLRVIGKRSQLDDDIVSLIGRSEELTAHNDKLTLVIALNYGGRDEIIDAVKQIALSVKEGSEEIKDITQERFIQALSTSDIPDPDLVIRTSGEKRLSNFLMWQIAYSELAFIDCLWPDFTRDILIQTVEEFQMRERRFGACSPA